MIKFSLFILVNKIMNFKKSFLGFFILFFIYNVSLAQQDGLKYINKEDLRRHLEFISSDSLDGRCFGTEKDGLGITSDYVKNCAVKIGLTPATEDYFQKMEIYSEKTDTQNSFLEVGGLKSPRKFGCRAFVKLQGNNDNYVFKNEKIVLAGFGWKSDTSEYNDFAGKDFKGKVVVIAEGTPENFLTGKNSRWNSRLEQTKLDFLLKENPKAVIIITNPKDDENKTFTQINVWLNRQRFELGTNNEEIVPGIVLIAKPEFGDAILGGKGKYKKYLGSVSENHNMNLQCDEKVFLNGQVINDKTSFEGRNIIAVVEGSDPVLKDECIVFMAHYDHLGIGKDGDVYNGADDNGSGTVTLLEVADAFAHLEKKPKRSIVFLWVTGEELGMFGSRYYADNPVFSMAKTKACINLDMVGRVYEPRDSVWKDSPKLVKDFDGVFTLSNKVWPELRIISDSICSVLGLHPDNSLPDNFLRSSDHYQFHKNGVPILNVATGYHADYHKVTDEISRINFEKMKRVADLCFLVGLEVANRDEISISTK